ncbi:alpha-mannosidase [bacterium]|nr:alpha-mannosidase [bacterium]
MSERILHLVCNSHIDPVWLWEWEEGLAETLATFRTAVRFCEAFDGFVFCHNEALLYQWTEEHEPALFASIQDLVARDRWHIMGGWYVQPDCNLPCGEAFVRQCLVGKTWFLDRFSREPRVAVNLDPFGHTRGLVQILAKAGYTGYLFCRPDRAFLPLPGDDFIWKGYDGSTVIAHRAPDHYNSRRGEAAERIERWLSEHPGISEGMLLWGVGNHGGGPSAADLGAIAALQGERTDIDIRHSTPEAFFSSLAERRRDLPEHAAGLNPWAVGCYTSMAEVKERYRRLENSLFLTEKMAAHAALNGLVDYPRDDIDAAVRDMLFASFHDILPGSCTVEAMEQALRRMDHGLELLARIRTRAFFSLLAGEPQAQPDELPVFVYNPHPVSVRCPIQMELQAAEPNFDSASYRMPEIQDRKGSPVPVQVEKESSSIRDDHRKRIVFTADLRPSSLTRYSVRFRQIPVNERPFPEQPEELHFDTGSAHLTINRNTGLLDLFRIGKTDLLSPGACRFLVMRDDADPWGMRVTSFTDTAGAFTLMSPEECGRAAGVEGDLAPVRIIESGPVRTIVEALFSHGSSAIVLRYKIPHEGTEVEVEARVHWAEPDRMLKLSLPTPLSGTLLGQTAYGVEEYHEQERELVAQKWLLQQSGNGKQALSVINDRTWGFDRRPGELRLSLLRSPAWAGHPVGTNRLITEQDRHTPRQDQGCRMFRFWLSGGDARERRAAVEFESRLKAEYPPALCCFPPGEGTGPVPAVTLSNPRVQLAAMKFSEKGNRLILRLFNPLETAESTRIALPVPGKRFSATLAAFEIQTLAIDLESGEAYATDLLERRLDKGMRP